MVVFTISSLQFAICGFVKNDVKKIFPDKEMGDAGNRQ